MVIHTCANDPQLHLTPRESERLRQVSYQRQLEAGFKNPGHAGLVARHSSTGASESTPGLEVRKNNALTSDSSEGEKV